MKDYTDEQIVKMYENLPGDLKAAIFSVDTGKIVEGIGRKRNLAIDKIGELGNETGMVMLGLTHPNQFISNLADRLEVDKQKAREIAEDVNVQIFKKVRESLKKIHNIRDEEETKVTGSPKDSPLGSSQGESLGRIESREEILKEIERKETPPALKIKLGDKPSEPPVPDILKGSTTTSPPVPPAKTEQKYQSGTDPYREPVE